jgi:hypothetical protein
MHGALSPTHIFTSFSEKHHQPFGREHVGAPRAHTQERIDTLVARSHLILSSISGSSC